MRSHLTARVALWDVMVPPTPTPTPEFLRHKLLNDIAFTNSSFLYPGYVNIKYGKTQAKLVDIKAERGLLPGWRIKIKMT